jgi:hypothetical protein
LGINIWLFPTRAVGSRAKKRLPEIDVGIHGDERKTRNICGNEDDVEVSRLARTGIKKYTPALCVINDNFLTPICSRRLNIC